MTATAGEVATVAARFRLADEGRRGVPPSPVPGPGAGTEAPSGARPRRGSVPPPGEAHRSLASIVWQGRLLLASLVLASGRRRALRRLAGSHPLTGERRQFLALDIAGDGRVVEVFGDLGSADAVAVVVPGMGSDLWTFDRHVSAPAAHLWQRLGADHPDRSVAVVGWLGYDAPDHVGEAASAGRAVDGGRALAALVHDLRLDPAVAGSVVAHSYGSVVAAMALLRDGLDPDNVLAMGSPGMVVGHTRAFGRPATDFFSMAAPGDPVAWLNWFGVAPSLPFTGFRRLAAAGDGHGSYLEPGSVSQHNAVSVVADDDESLLD